MAPRVTRPPPFSQTLSRPKSQDQLLGISLSTQKSITKLNAEISKLRAIAAFTEAEAEEKLVNQNEQMNKTLNSLREAYEKALVDSRKVTDEIIEKEEFIKNIQLKHEEKEKDLEKTERECDSLGKELDEATKGYENLRCEIQHQESHMAGFEKSLVLLLQDQEILLEAARKVEDDKKKESKDRMNTIYKLLDQEYEFRKESIALKKLEGIEAMEVITTEAMQNHQKTLEVALGSLHELTVKRSHHHGQPLKTA